MRPFRARARAPRSAVANRFPIPRALGLLPPAALAAAAGCAVAPEARMAEERFTQGGGGAVDVLFVVDDSNSMEATQSALAGGADEFVAALDAQGAQWHAGVVTTDADEPTDRGRLRPVSLGGQFLRWEQAGAAASLAAALRPGIAGSPFERGMQNAWAALSPPLATHENAGFRRSDARLAIVFVSDEDDCSDEGEFAPDEPSTVCVSEPGRLVGVDEFLERFRGLVASPADVLLASLVETGEAPEEGGCGGSTPGTRYMALAARTGAESSPHCGDLAPGLARIGAQAAGVRVAFPLAGWPDPASLVVTVTPADGSAGIDVPEDPAMLEGWSWDEAGAAVRFWGSAVPAPASVVTLRYVVASGD